MARWSSKDRRRGPGRAGLAGAARGRAVPEWAPTETSVGRLDDGSLAVGSRVRVEQPWIRLTEYVVTELESSRSFTWVATGRGLRTTARRPLEEFGSGSTRVT